MRQPEFEKKELIQIYIDRGLQPDLAGQVAEQLMAKDALGAHARDELGISEISTARPFQAAFASAGAFLSGALAPLLLGLASPPQYVQYVISAGSLLLLAALGVLGAKAGGAPAGRPTMRIVFWGALAMLTTAAIGAVVGRAV